MKKLFTHTIPVVAVIGCIFALFQPFPHPSKTIQFLNEPCILPVSNYEYKTCWDINVRVDNKHYVIPQGFNTDLASIPKWYWSIISPAESSLMGPSILHDYLYVNHDTVSRKEADLILYCALLENGVNNYDAYKIYIAVRLFGSNHYKD